MCIRDRSGHVDLQGCLLIILLSADFFIPMRQLGSFFHIAMNGMAASDKIFALLDLPEPDQAKKDCQREGDIVCENVCFSYDGERQVLTDINLTIAKKGLTAIAGESGCGKSTIASILMGRSKNYKGSIKIGDTELRDISEESLLKHITYVSHQSYLSVSYTHLDVYKRQFHSRQLSAHSASIRDKERLVYICRK